MTPARPEESRCCGDKSRLRQLELVIGILFGVWNNLSTVLNAVSVGQKGLTTFSVLMIFFLFFPGFITSVAFLVLHFLGHRRFGRLPPGRVGLYFVLLLTCYPFVPTLLSISALVTGQRYHLARLAKLFEGFLDDGPQFVLKLVVVVLYGVGLSDEDDDIIFLLSMVTSSLALIYFGIKFNERKTSCLSKVLICFPMLGTFALARAFLLAVFLQETLGHPNERFGGVIVLLIFLGINMGSFKVCGQDSIRSFVFGLCSLLIPTGYGNDAYLYQCPHQSVVKSPPIEAMENDVDGLDECPTGQASGTEQQSEPTEGQPRGHHALLEKVTEAVPDTVKDKAYHMKQTVAPILAQLRRGKPEGSGSNTTTVETAGEARMQSGKFLILYGIANAVLLSSCAIYLSTTRDLPVTADNALILPLVLAVIPGLLFTFSRAILMSDLRPTCVRKHVWAIIKVSLSVIFGVIAVASVIPALLFTTLYKVAEVVDEWED